MLRHSYSLPRLCRTLTSLLLLLLIAPCVFSQTADARLKAIDEYAARMGRDWEVPGFAVAIVKDDKVIFAKGYGVREMNKPEAVDAQTVFAIASNSKAFAAASVAVLVDEGKLSWDDPVTKHLPEFQLSDSYVTRELTIRDLLSHRSGLATFSGDLLWYNTTYERAEILRRARYLKPATSFRSRYGYQNIMFLAAGELAARVAGRPWDELVRERFFAPLGMTRTTTNINTFPALGNVATPHNKLDGKLRKVHYSSVDGAGAAAAINSSVTDMAQWLRLQLADGKFDGKQIISAKQIREMRAPHTIINISEASEKLNPQTNFRAYGLGWSLSDYHGRKTVGHGGALDGMLSQVGMIPTERLGVVVLTNSETSLGSLLVNRIFDTFLNVTPRDWSGESLARAKAGEAAEKLEREKLEAARTPGTKPSLATDAYAGRYTGALFGDALVANENGKLVVRLAPAPAFVGDLEHWHHDTFRIRWRDSVAYPFGAGFVTFVLDEKGKIAEMKIDVPNPDFDFKELEFKKKVESND